MITVNRRDTLPWHRDMTVQELLDRLRYTFPRVVVTVNGEVVPYGTYDQTTIPDGADVRVIHLMAGG